MAAIIPGNGKTDLGKSGTPWTNIYGTAIYQNNQQVVSTNDARLPVADEKAALAGSSGTPSASNRYVTQADRSRLAALPDVTGLTGGGSTKLDGQVTAGVAVGLVVCFVDANGGSPIWRAYQLTSGTTAESSPNVIRPDDYATTSNEKVWKLVSTATSADALTVAFDPDFYTAAGTSLADHLEGIDTMLGEVLTTRTGVYRDVRKSAHEFEVATGTPTLGQTTKGNVFIRAATLSNSATKGVQVVFKLPEAWDTASPPKIKLEYYAAVTGDVRWSVGADLFDTDDDLTVTLDTPTEFTDTVAVADSLRISDAMALVTTGAGRWLLLDIQRLGSAAGDTLAGDVFLTGVHLQYLESAVEPSAW